MAIVPQSEQKLQVKGRMLRLLTIFKRHFLPLMRVCIVAALLFSIHTFAEKISVAFAQGVVSGEGSATVAVERENLSKARTEASGQAKKNILRGGIATRKRKVRTQVTFRRPKTLKTPRAPKYPRKSVPSRPK